MERFYQDIDDASIIGERSELFLCGDFNSRLGRDQNTYQVDYQGKYAHGKQNENGERLASYLSANALFSCNTAFQHPARHRTTWKGYNSNARQYYTQIDYIICRQNSKQFLCNARSSNNFQIFGDHKPVIAKIVKFGSFMKFKTRNIKMEKYKVEKLVNNTELRNHYRQKVSQHLIGKNETCKNPNQKLENLMDILTSSAKNCYAKFQTFGIIFIFLA